MTDKLCLFFLLSIGMSAFSQTDLEMLIRVYEQREVKAVLEKDTVALEKIWARNFRVNNPYNEIITNRDQVFGFMKSGRVNYSRFVRNVEYVDVKDDMVISMGHEDIEHANTGERYRRRFTNIWMRDEGEWKIVIRHANIICTEK